MSATGRTTCLRLRVSPEQLAVLRRAAAVANMSLKDFILNAACHAAEETLDDQAPLVVSGSQYQALLERLDRPGAANPRLADLMSRRAPWEEE